MNVSDSCDLFIGLIRCSTKIGLIQLWRRVTDSALIDECTDDILIDNATVPAAAAAGGGGICFERARSRKCLFPSSTLLLREDLHACLGCLSHSSRRSIAFSPLLRARLVIIFMRHRREGM